MCVFRESSHVNGVSAGSSASRVFLGLPFLDVVIADALQDCNPLVGDVLDRAEVLVSEQDVQDGHQICSRQVGPLLQGRKRQEPADNHDVDRPYHCKAVERSK